MQAVKVVSSFIHRAPADVPTFKVPGYVLSAVFSYMNECLLAKPLSNIFLITLDGECCVVHAWARLVWLTIMNVLPLHVHMYVCIPVCISAGKELCTHTSLDRDSIMPMM